jgi:hypothetical protein
MFLLLLLLLLLLQAQLASSMWTASGFYHLLPWSCVVLESVPEAEVGGSKAVADAACMINCCLSHTCRRLVCAVME